MSGPEENIVVPDQRHVTYERYLRVPELIKLQNLLSKQQEHDEMLFIIIHQAYELWFKQILHEVQYAARKLQEGKLGHFIRTLNRIVTIQDVLIQQVSILETMTPTDFNRFRDNLNPASGFQSAQFRVLEFKLGERDERFLKFFEKTSPSFHVLEQSMHEPSLWDLFLRFLASKKFAIPTSILQRDVTKRYESNPEVVKVIEKIYREQDDHYEIYSAIEKLIDVDERVLLWRQRHVTMVERMIGNRRGTGGSSGVKYLSKTLEIRFFPEIWEVRNSLGGAYGAQ
jgi:tryptophan 2,3-dioxygenase